MAARRGSTINASGPAAGGSFLPIGDVLLPPHSCGAGCLCQLKKKSSPEMRLPIDKHIPTMVHYFCQLTKRSMTSRTRRSQPPGAKAEGTCDGRTGSPATTRSLHGAPGGQRGHGVP